MNCGYGNEHEENGTRWRCILEVEPVGKELEGGGVVLMVGLRLWASDAVSRNRKWKHQRKRKPMFQGEYDELISYTYVM